MNNVKPIHLPVLLDRVVENALPENGRYFADCTFGLGGHTNAILKAYPDIRVAIGVDRDPEILEYSKSSCTDERVKRYLACASDLPEVLRFEGINGVDGILLDLGVSSWQLDSAERGFSFMKSGPLDMRMNKLDPITAEELVNTLEQSELEKLFFEYGEEKFSRRIAAAIVSYRKEHRITKTDELAKIVCDAVPAAGKVKNKIHPATRVFQAIRIEVNNELNNIQNTLNDIKMLECWRTFKYHVFSFFRGQIS